MLKTARYNPNGMPFNLFWWGFNLSRFPLACIRWPRGAGAAKRRHLVFFASSGGLLIICLCAFLGPRGRRDRPRCLAWHLFVAPCLRPAPFPAGLSGPRIVAAKMCAPNARSLF